MLNVGFIITQVLLLLRYGKANGSEDPETIAIEKIVCYTHRAPKKGTGHTMVGDTGKHHGQTRLPEVSPSERLTSVRDSKRDTDV